MVPQHHLLLMKLFALLCGDTRTRCLMGPRYKVDDDESGTIEYEEFFQLDYFIKRAQLMFEAADEGATHTVTSTSLMARSRHEERRVVTVC
jgi:hypothetical protein